jgi:aminobenzoyl-glutamate utilization protein B
MPELACCKKPTNRFAANRQSMIGSATLRDVSCVVPTVQARAVTHAIGTPGHSWQITAQGKSAAATKEWCTLQR